MSQPNTILSLEECIAISRRWRKDGLTEEERNDFVTRASKALTDSDMVNDFLDKISKACKLAQSINDVMYDLATDLVDSPYGWITIVVSVEWDEFRDRFLDHMVNSTVNAENISSILRDFDTVYMSQVETIQTEQDRVSAIAALDRLVVDLDTWDKTPEMIQRFQDLRRDIEAFINKFTVSIEQNVFVPLTSEIEALDAQIIAAHKSIGVLGGDGILRALGLGAKASNVIASLQYHRDKKADTLRKLRGAVTAVKKLVAPLVKAIEDEVNLEQLITDLIAFAELWASVRSQSVQFNEILSRGLEAATNMGFKSQVKLARQVCTPLRDGLDKYIQEVWDWASTWGARKGS